MNGVSCADFKVSCMMFCCFLDIYQPPEQLTHRYGGVSQIHTLYPCHSDNIASSLILTTILLSLRRLPEQRPVPL
jgi:hypothetical protein